MQKLQKELFKMTRETVTSENREDFIAKKMGNKPETKGLANKTRPKEPKREWYEANPHHKTIEAHGHSSEAYKATQTAMEKENHKNHLHAANMHNRAHTSWSMAGNEYKNLAKEHLGHFEMHKGQLKNYEPE